MAKKNSTLFSRLTGLIWLLITGGSIAGWAAPDLPVIGPSVKKLLNAITVAHAEPSSDRSAAPSVPGGSAQGSTSLPSAGGNAGALAPHSGAAGGLRKPDGTVTVASFNIQVFGESKLSKSGVVNILAQVVRQFDVVAIQEIRCVKDNIIPDFVRAVNADGSRYSYVVGPRLGRTVSTEQYAFVFDTNRIEIDTSSSGTIQDTRDLLHREPFVTRFRARTATPASSFTFWLVNTHTDPDEVPQEIDTLADVFLVMQQARRDEDDVILLGDLNANDQQFGRLGQIPGMTWAVQGTTTNTRRTKMYDNLLFDRNRTAEFTGRWGVLDLEAAFRLTREQALEVSDHLPVWAEFQANEAPSAFAAHR